MVDKLRKFGEMLWLNKERLILVAMVAILCFQVYKVVYPVEKLQGETPRPPKQAPGDAKQPPPPADSPTITFAGDYLGLTRRNPFWYFSGRNQRSGSQNTGDVEIKLLDIQNSAAGPRAQLQTGTTTKWYNVGDSFEQFKLQSVDGSSNTAVVYVESLGREQTLQKE